MALPQLVARRGVSVFIGHRAMGYHFGSWRVQSFGQGSASGLAASSRSHRPCSRRPDMSVRPSQKHALSFELTGSEG
jgi:hypothetical protein